MFIQCFLKYMILGIVYILLILPGTRKMFSGKKREVFKKKIWTKKKRLLEYLMQTSSWNFIWQVILVITHNPLKILRVGIFIINPSVLTRISATFKGQVLHWHMFPFSQLLWISWRIMLFQDFRSWKIWGLIIILWDMILFCEG